MARYAAFLRGMNLGNRRITNDELCRALAGLGLDSPAAFLASGNVVFGSDETSSARLSSVVSPTVTLLITPETPSARHARRLDSRRASSLSRTPVR